MFILYDIETLPDDLTNLPDDVQHKLTFKAVFTIKEVPDTFTGIVFADATGALQMQHFNSPKGNKRKVITLKNKLAKGSFDMIKQQIFAISKGESVNYPLQVALLQRRISGTPRA